jgi:hypothetical protein
VILLVVIPWEFAGAPAASAQTAVDSPFIVLQVRGKVFANGRQVKTQTAVQAGNAIDVTEGASLILINSNAKIRVEGPTSGNIDDILARAHTAPDNRQSGAFGWIYKLLQTGSNLALTRDTVRDGADDAWALQIDTSGSKCVRAQSLPVLVAHPEQAGRYVRFRDVVRNLSAFARIGADSRLQWPSNLPLADRASYEVRIDGVATALRWDIRLAPADLDSSAETARFFMDSACYDQLYAQALALPDSAVVRSRSH